ncbi:TRAP transporter small permease subunit [Parashewanella tropica]|uniref:TRAP transporter small permease subunit n=1 Tax=Parashewanella tropica TaxID=2547970 RepID=UPI001FE33DDA|nr:TRAP transporter small permease subunit [Parashewanella tropica]
MVQGEGTEKLTTQIDKLSTLSGKGIAWLTLFMVLTMTTVVILRYGFDIGWIWLQESVLYMHAFVLMIAMSYTLLVDKHVRVDIFYRNLPKTKKNRVNLFGHIFFLLPTCGFILIMSWQYVTQSWSILESSQEAGGLPLMFILKSLLIITPVLLTLQTIAEIIKIIFIKEAN